MTEMSEFTSVLSQIASVLQCLFQDQSDWGPK